MSKYIFYKSSNGLRPRNISNEDYASASYGDILEYQPNDRPLRIYHFSGSVTGSDEYNKLKSLKNTINYYSFQEDLYNFENFYNKPTNLLCFNSYHLGSGLEKGTVELNFYISGSIISSCSDFREDGILYDNNDNKIGAILYKEGFILINNTASLTDDILDFNDGTFFNDNPRWIHSFLDSSESVYYDISYNVVNEVAQNTYFIYANKYELNHSNNLTYIESGSYSNTSNKYHFLENDKIKIKNTIKSPFVSGSSNFQKQTFITRIGLYDETKKLIAIANLANPVKKTEEREYLFKIKIDI